MNSLDQLNDWLGMPPETWFVFGAKSMELELERAGATVPRTTFDVDIAIVIDDWDSYERLMTQLVLDSGFERDPDIMHRLVHPTTNYVLDIIPFGSLAPLGAVDWPNNEARSMDVRGLSEIMHKGCWPHKTKTGHIHIARFESLVLLKWLAWRDRGNRTKDRDLSDIHTVVEALHQLLPDLYYARYAELSELSMAPEIISYRILGESIVACFGTDSKLVSIVIDSISQFVNAPGSASATAAARILTTRGIPDVDLAMDCLNALLEGLSG